MPPHYGDFGVRLSRAGDDLQSAPAATFSWQSHEFRRFVDVSRGRGVWCGSQPCSEFRRRRFKDHASLMDRLIAAQTRLEQALDRLSAALAARREREARLAQDKAAVEQMLADRSSESAAASAMAGEIERIRSENVLLRADKSEVADKLDAAIGRLKILIES